MSERLLLDTHTLVWLRHGHSIRPAALSTLAEAAAAGQLYASHITLWELGVAQESVPYTEDHTPETLRRPPDAEACRALGIRMAAITLAIAAEAAAVPSIYQSGDPGDCFLIATARVRRMRLVTKDARILALSSQNPEYLQVLAC